LGDVEQAASCARPVDHTADSDIRSASKGLNDYSIRAPSRDYTGWLIIFPLGNTAAPGRFVREADQYRHRHVLPISPAGRSGP